MYRNMLALFTTAAIAISALPAVAQAGTTTIAVPVFYGDLDLTKPAGRHTMLDRVHTASRQACGSAFPFSIQVAEQYKRCVRDATSSALGTVGLSGPEEMRTANR